MKVFIAGVNHNDPFGRARLVQWFSSIGEKQSRAPTFIAVEWARDIFQKIEAQRPHFMELCQNRWPYIGFEEIQVLSKTLGYEADSHYEAFPNVKIIWLDEDRDDIDQSKISSYSQDKFKTYERLLKDVNEEELNRNFLKLLHIKVHGIANKHYVKEKRDKKFADKISSYLEKTKHNNDDFGLCIVGMSHASRNEGCMTELIESRGFQCDVVMLGKVVLV